MAPAYLSDLPIAFSKIDGFEVTPLTPSVSISCLRSPLATKPRARKSSQTAWPWFSSALTGFMVPYSVLRPFRVRGTFSGGKPNFVNTSLRGDDREYGCSRGITPFTSYRSDVTAHSGDLRDFVTAAKCRLRAANTDNLGIA